MSTTGTQPTTADESVERRRYRRVSVRIHRDEKFRALSKPQPNGQSLWLHLIIGPETTIVPGLIVGGELTLSESLGWPLEDFRTCWRELAERGMAKADWSNRLVWLPNAIAHNPPESPNVCIQWHRAFRDELPQCALLEEARARVLRFLNATRDVEGQPRRFFAQSFADAFAQGHYRPAAASRPRGAAATPAPPPARGRLVTPPLALRHLTYPSAIGKDVPTFLHDEFRRQLMSARSLSEGDADTGLLAWYPTVDAAWTGKPAGEDPVKFWRARFAEWIGTSGTPAAVNRVAGVDETRALLKRYRRAV